MKNNRLKNVFMADMNNLAYRYWFISVKHKEMLSTPLTKQIDQAIFNIVPDDRHKDNEQYVDLVTKKLMFIKGNVAKYFSYLFFNGIMASAIKYRPDEIILAVDSRGGGWRKEIYPEYKAGRRSENIQISKCKDINRLSTGENAVLSNEWKWDEFFGLYGQHLSTLRKLFPKLKLFAVKNVEADDIIGVLTKELHQYSNIICLSNDKDFYQLHKYANFNQLHPTTKEYINIVEPERAFILKLLLGDTSDNIPQLKKGMGIKRCNDLLDKPNGLSEFLEEDEEARENFKFAKTMADMDLIPMEHQKRILEKYDTFVGAGESDGFGFFDYAVKCGFSSRLHSQIQPFVRIINNLD